MLLFAALALMGIATALASAAVPEAPGGAVTRSSEPERAHGESAAEAAESAAEAVESAEEASESAEEAAASAEVVPENNPPRYVMRRIKRLTREIGRVKSQRQRLRARLTEVKRLPPTSKRRGPAIQHAREKYRKKRKRLRRLRRERRKLRRSAG
jgi:predicted RNase H-like nuclease (RuvC/YqgF family)